MKKFILIGIPGCGKSTLGKKMAHSLLLPFFDTDKLMLKIIKLDSPTDIFRAAFQGQFINAQKKVMAKLAKNKKPAVISTGAEVALIPECAALMKKMGTIIHIQRDPDLAVADMKKSRNNGFEWTLNGEPIDMRENGMKLYMKEYSQYEALADFKVENNGSEDEGLEKLLKLRMLSV